MLLKSLPDISKLNTSSVVDFDEMFSGCRAFISLPNLSKLKAFKGIKMNNTFSFLNLTYLPDISKWSKNNAKDMPFMFCGCSFLDKLPDGISSLNVGNVTDMSEIFNDCQSLTSISIFQT